MLSLLFTPIAVLLLPFGALMGFLLNDLLILALPDWRETVETFLAALPETIINFISELLGDLFAS